MVAPIPELTYGIFPYFPTATSEDLHGIRLGDRDAIRHRHVGRARLVL